MTLIERLQDYLRTVRSVTGIARIGNWLFFGAIIGTVSGIGAIAFTAAIDFLREFLYETTAGVSLPTETIERTTMVFTGTEQRHWLFLLLPALGGLAAGWLVFRFAPEAEGHGTDEVIRAYHHDRARIRRRVPFVKALASAMTIGSGGSAGREGPVAQIGAGFGAFLADLLRLPEKDRRLMVLAGIGGGIGSMFRAPLGGALFATEVLYREQDFEYEGLLPAIISAIVGYSVYSLWYGWGAIFTTPRLVFHQPLHLLLYLLFGILAAGLGIVYVRVFYGMRDRFFRRLKVPRHYRPAIGGLLLGIMAYAFPPVLGTGYGWIQLALYGEIALASLIVFPFLKIIATSITVGSGGSGGVFAPSLVIGGMLGGAFGTGCTILLPDWQLEPAAFIMVGMAGFFAGIAKVPIASLIMVAEMTGSYGLLVPTMLVAAVSVLITGRTTIYEMQVANRAESPAHRGEFILSILEKMRVRSCMIPPEEHQLIRQDMLLKDLIALATRTSLHSFFLVDEARRLIGVIALDDLRRIMLEVHLGPILVAKDLAVPPPPGVSPDDSLSVALQSLVQNGLDEIPVLEGRSGRIAGLVRKKDLVVVYTQALAEEQERKVPTF